MNILFIKHFAVGFMVSEIPRVSVFGYFPIWRVLNCIDQNPLTSPIYLFHRFKVRTYKNIFC